MARPLTPNRLPPQSAAYIAGLVDGEGTITLTAQHRGGNRRLVVTSRQALALLGQLVPYLHTYKVRRARLALRHYIILTPRNGKYTPAIKRARLRFETKLLSESAHPR